MSGAFQIGRLFGIRIRLHYSWLFVFFMVAWSLATSYLPASYPGWQPALRWGAGFAGSIMLFTSVLIHEMSHSLVAMSRGYKVRGITLFLLGGVAEIEKEANKASEEFLIAVVGPLTSFVLSGIFFGIYFLVQPDGSEPVMALSFYLGMINFVLGAFNLIPGFPMDGGRVLRSIVWKATGSLKKATIVAANVGMGIGTLFMLGGAYIAFSSRDLMSGLWIAFIGWFIQSSASSAKAQQKVTGSLLGRRVRDGMARQFTAVTPGTSLQELVGQHITRDFQRAFLVMLGNQFYGLITASDVRKVPPDQWANTPVTAVMTRAERVQSVTPDDALEVALQKLAANGIHQLVVMENGQPIGFITREHVLGVMALTDLFAGREAPR